MGSALYETFYLKVNDVEKETKMENKDFSCRLVSLINVFICAEVECLLTPTSMY